mmetsp:Transcript_22228/g.30603  ORF Transcript_22228/g.30603 Transcript_22228/m.30603 type:complete len:325 (+) Transcript_22228:19-993(+)
MQMRIDSVLHGRESANLKEMEYKITTLERINFDLKMQLFYLNENKNNANGNSNLNRESNSYDDFEDQSDENMEILILRGEIESLKRKIEDLEMENQTLKLKEAEKYQRLLKAKPYEAILDNHKKEREEALAIAQHDAAFIYKLQQDIIKIQAQHAKDIVNYQELQLKLNEKSNLLLEKEEIIVQLTSFNSSMKQQLEILTEKSKYHELVLRSNGWNGSTLSSSESKSDKNTTSDITYSELQKQLNLLRRENEGLTRQLESSTTSPSDWNSTDESITLNNELKAVKEVNRNLQQQVDSFQKTIESIERSKLQELQALGEEIETLR